MIPSVVAYSTNVHATYDGKHTIGSDLSYAYKRRARACRPTRKGGLVTEARGASHTELALEGTDGRRYGRTDGDTEGVHAYAR
jgi:hypothetical protein